VELERCGGSGAWWRSAVGWEEWEEWEVMAPARKLTPLAGKITDDVDLKIDR
jgi:hypothetical protein